MAAQANAWVPEHNNVGALKGRNTQGLDMPQSLSMNLVHLICSTKNRDASLTPAIRSKLHAYELGILQEWNSPAIVIGGRVDHKGTKARSREEKIFCFGQPSLDAQAGSRASRPLQGLIRFL